MWQLELINQVQLQQQQQPSVQVLPILISNQLVVPSITTTEYESKKSLDFLFGIPWQQFVSSLFQSLIVSNLKPIQQETTTLSIFHPNKESLPETIEATFSQKVAPIDTTTTTTASTTTTITWWKPLYILLLQYHQLIWKQVVQQFEKEFDLQLSNQKDDNSIALQNLQSITLNYLIQECNIEQLLQPKHRLQHTITPLESQYYHSTTNTSTTHTSTHTTTKFNNSYIELLNQKQLETLVKIQASIQKQFQLHCLTWEQFCYLNLKKNHYLSMLSLPSYVLQITNSKLLYFYMQWLRCLVPRYTTLHHNSVIHSFWLGMWMIPESFMNWKVEPLAVKQQQQQVLHEVAPIVQQQIETQPIPTMKWIPPSSVPLIQPTTTTIPTAVTNTMTSSFTPLPLPSYSTLPVPLQHKQSIQQQTNKSASNQFLLNMKPPSMSTIPTRTPTQQTRIQPQYNQDLLKQLESRLF